MATQIVMSEAPGLGSKRRQLVDMLGAASPPLTCSPTGWPACRPAIQQADISRQLDPLKLSGPASRSPYKKERKYD